MLLYDQKIFLIRCDHERLHIDVLWCGADQPPVLYNSTLPLH